MNATRTRTESLCKEMKHLGLSPGDSVLVHSSLSAMGWIEGGASTVVEALLMAVAPGGTILFPTLTGKASDSPQHRPCCDHRQRTTWCGAIPCAALPHPACHRSIHPTHAVAAIGPNAAQYTTGHPSALSPCGTGSPYTRLAEAGGHILLLGVNHTANTTFHTAEELVDAPYVAYPGRYPCPVIDLRGDSHEIMTPIHRWDRPRRFEDWHERLVAAGIVREGLIAAAPCRLMGAQALIQWLVAQLQHDPRALLAPGTPYS